MYSQLPRCWSSLAEGVVTGKFPKRVLRHVLEWYELHRSELESNWEHARKSEPLEPIEPLE